MCRSIKTLRRAEPPVDDREVEEAALQFVRKVSGYRAPSRANAEAFDRAVREVADASRKLLESLPAPRRDGPRGAATGRQKSASIAPS